MVWDSNLWKETAKKAMLDRDYQMMRRGRIGVYADTLRCVMDGEYVTESGRRIELKHPPSVPGGVHSARIVLTEIPRYEETIVEVWNEDTLLVAKRLQEEGHKTAALNMANGMTPGGGVVMGGNTQEENLFRRSNLFMALYPFDGKTASLFDIEPADSALGRYPMDKNHGGIYAEGVTVFRGTEAEGYPLLDEPYQVNVISVAAIKRPQLDQDGMMTPAMVAATKNKIRTILRLAILNGCDAVVLGAFGCGAFRNPAGHVAAIFGEVLREPEFAHSFRRIVFAILCFVMFLLQFICSLFSVWLAASLYMIFLNSIGKLLSKFLKLSF